MLLARLLSVLIGLAAIAETGFAQKELPVADIFTFAIVKKTPAHPFYGMGDSLGYMVNGVEGDTIYLIRDSTYAIHFDTLSAAQFPYYYTEPLGGSLNRYKKLRIGEYFEKNHIYIRADDETPDTLYYGNLEAAYMGGTFVIVDSLPSSVWESQSVVDNTRVSSRIAPNPVRDLGVLSFQHRTSGRVQVQIVDALGRIVEDRAVDVLPDARIEIDRGNLSTGIYFYRVVDAESNAEVLTTGSFHIQ